MNGTIEREAGRVERVLIANRGEIASRIARACRRLGLSPVGVFSDADAEMPFVRDLDAAVRLPGHRPAETYLSVEALIEAGRRLGADAIHPGYGFLAERAELARACREAGWTFVGPSAEVIESMASKRRARALVEGLGLPVIPGWHGEEDDPSRLLAEARRIGFPVLLKASAGGGGKGMRVVREESALEEAVASCRREAASAFGDGALLVEAYLEAPRHIEVQILGDAYGEVIHLHERECSIQRRHQKVIEETPAPHLDEGLRRRLFDASVAIGRALRYEGAGTVEWLVGQRSGADAAFFFLEVNTRLQVEHAITEEVIGLDLVVAQLRIARGEPLPLAQEAVASRGVAFEARLYAEDPSAGGLPQTGVLLDWHLPPAEGLRVEAGVVTGTEIGPDYDPMLAKIVAYGDSRSVALDRLRGALCSLSVGGLTTNREMLLDLLGSAELREGRTHTAFLEEWLQSWAPATSAIWIERAALAAVLSSYCERQERRRVLRSITPGWRGIGERFTPPERVRYRIDDGEPIVVEYRPRGVGELAVRVSRASTVGEGDSSADESEPSWEPSSKVTLVSYSRTSIELERDGLRWAMRVARSEGKVFVHHPEAALLLFEEPRFDDPAEGSTELGCVAPMAGTVVAVHVAPGQAVEAGELLCVIEAMKMEHPMRAAEAARIEAVYVVAGASVQRGEPLFLLA